MTAMPPRPSRRIARTLRALAWVIAGLTQGCAPRTPAGGAFTVREVTPTFFTSFDAHDPSLASDGRGAVALTWWTGDSLAADAWLSVSRDSGATFSPPQRVSGTGRRVTPDTAGGPVAALGQDGALAVAWSGARGDTTGAIDLYVRASSDFGSTLGNITTVNDDATGPPPGARWRKMHDWPLTHRPAASHRSACLAFIRDGSLLAAWIDDRRVAEPATGRVGTLWLAQSHDGGQTWSPNEALSDSVSPLCRPALSMAPDGAVALAYRGATDDVRDPRLALSDDGHEFRVDTLLSQDGWSLARCPGEGAAVTWVNQAAGYAAWFTGVAPAGVYVARWPRATGLAGLKRPAADGLAGASHPSLAMLGESLLLGVAASSEQESSRHVMAVRELDAAGNWSAWTLLGANPERGGLVAASRSVALACWIEREPGHTRLRIASLTRRPR